jgi:hypothetical protein
MGDKKKKAFKKSKKNRQADANDQLGENAGEGRAMSTMAKDRK